MQPLLEAIRQAIDDSASAEQKAAGAAACRTLLTALEAAPGTPLGPTPPTSPLTRLNVDHALDLVIAKLRSMAPAAAVPNGKAFDVPLVMISPPGRRTP